MHAACIASIEAEASEKLTKVIKAKTRVSTGIIYQILFITVQGTENKQILGSLVRSQEVISKPKN